MFYWLIELSNTVPGFAIFRGLLNVFRYITFRTGGAVVTGALMILSGLVVSTLLWANPLNPYVWIVLAVTLGFGFVGFYDDYLKVTQQTHSGFAGKLRLAIEALIAVAACYSVVRLGRDPLSNALVIPFFKDVILNFGLFFLIFGAFIIVGAGNA